MRETINQIINGYINSKSNEEFKQNPMQQLISQTLKKSIIKTAHIDPQQYVVKCSAGQGNWARIPWAGVFDRDITTTAQQGFDIVYLFVEDMSGVYLSLNQGWTFYRNTYGRDGMNQIKRIAGYLRDRLRSDHRNFPKAEIDLKASDQLGKGYEAGNIIAKYYPKESIPPDATLANDLRQLMGIFLEMKDFLPGKDDDLGAWIEKCNLIIDTGIEEDDEQFQTAIQNRAPKQFEDKPEVPPSQSTSSSRTSYNRDLQKAKNALHIANYTCEFDSDHKTFIGKASGKPFVEVHHLIPMSRQNEYQVSLDVEANIVALCPNCHRRIHLGTEEEINQMRTYLIEKRRDRMIQAGLIER